MTNLTNYLLHNNIEDKSFNNLSSKAHLIQKMTGGSCCSGQNVFKYTLQKYNNNQKTLYGDVLRGGRVSLPSQYFGINTNNVYKPIVSFTKTNTVTPTLAKQALTSSFQFGGKSKMSTVDTSLKRSIIGGNVNTHQQKELLTMYHTNLDQFITNVRNISGGTITKTSINKAMTLLKI